MSIVDAWKAVPRAEVVRCWLGTILGLVPCTEQRHTDYPGEAVTAGPAGVPAAVRIEGEEGGERRGAVLV